jgi:hypothetical protein
MRNMIGLVVTLLIVFAGYKMFFTQMQSASGGSAPAQSISSTGAKNDLIAIAQAERLYQAEHGSYATLDQLSSTGSMNMSKSGREGYTYSATPSGNSFRAEARCSNASGPCTGYSIDETMEIHSIP